MGGAGMAEAEGMGRKGLGAALVAEVGVLLPPEKLYCGCCWWKPGSGMTRGGAWEDEGMVVEGTAVEGREETGRGGAPARSPIKPCCICCTVADAGRMAWGWVCWARLVSGPCCCWRYCCCSATR